MKIMLILLVLLAIWNIVWAIKYHNNISLVAGILAVVLFMWSFYMYIRYPAPDRLTRSNGMIHHPTYGDYPEKVSFHQGMSIMPGQTAELTIGIDEGPNE